MENVTKIEKHFWIIEENGVRIFLFEGTKKALLIDTGFGSLPLKDMVSELTDLPVFVIHTHTDVDHIGCDKDFHPIYMHPSEMDYYKNGLPEGRSMDNVYPVWENDIIDLGHWKFEVILTPGHTPGSIMLLERQHRMLISGDTIQNQHIFLFGPGRNVPAFQHSLKKIIEMSDNFDSIWPSHGSYPLQPNIIPSILKGSQDLLAGKLPAFDPPFPLPCSAYMCDVVSFLY